MDHALRSEQDLLNIGHALCNEQVNIDLALYNEQMNIGHALCIEQVKINRTKPTKNTNLRGQT